jgi:hypothetical protein
MAHLPSKDLKQFSTLFIQEELTATEDHLEEVSSTKEKEPSYYKSNSVYTSLKLS